MVLVLLLVAEGNWFSLGDAAGVSCYRVFGGGGESRKANGLLGWKGTYLFFEKIFRKSCRTGFFFFFAFVFSVPVMIS